LRHVAIVMDGNGRWAQTRGLPRTAGHRQGLLAVIKTVRAARELGIQYLTLFGFSDENWSRPRTEVENLFALLDLYLIKEASELANAGIRLRVIGDLARLPEKSRELLAEALHVTRHGRAMTLTIALSYGGRGEIVRACTAIARRAAAGTLDPETVSSEVVERHLDTAGLPDPDLVIRTAGEQRLSNFLLWQMAYAELFFTPVTWPDFKPEHLRLAIECFGKRTRSYGDVPVEAPSHPWRTSVESTPHRSEHVPPRPVTRPLVTEEAVGAMLASVAPGRPSNW
jgi:undecaprenyl diphosphate synthase